MQVYTIIDVKSFLRYGVLWLSSIRKIANYSGEIIAILEGSLTPQIHDRLKKENVKIVESKSNTIDCLLNSMQDLTIDTFSFWDIHGYFLEKIDLQIQDKLIFFGNENFAGNKETLSILLDYNRLNQFCGFEPKLDVYNYTNVYFKENAYLYSLNESDKKNEDAYLNFLNSFISKNQEIYYDFYERLYPKPNAKLITSIKHE